VGVGTAFKISKISNAREISSIIINKKKELQQQSVDNMNPTVGESSADELKKYKELLDGGVISQEEFEAKKKQLLDL
jgi:predicted Zn-dependent peptidase